jgi:aspartyl aminopeptidase
MPAIDDLLSFLDESPSPFHAVSASVARLDAAGFRVTSHAAVDDEIFAESKCVLTHGGAVIAWSWPRGSDAARGGLFVGAHTDSPCLRLKPRPNSRAAGLSVLEVEIYGGVLLNSWLDRDLGLAGVVHSVDGASRLCETRRPIARVPQLAIHLDRDVNDKGLLLNRQNHMRPVWGSEGGDVLDLLGIGPEETFDIALFDVTPATLVGAGNEFVASGRIDNLVSCWAAVDAIRHAETDRPMIVCLFDHEEVGSESTTGAAGPLLEHVVDELLRVRGIGDERFDFLRKSMCISADNAHGLHPNYPERHDANHAPLVNRGPALKHNANQRYATSAKGAAVMCRIATEAGVSLQDFVSNNAMPCGSTIGPITATRLGIETVDVGVPQLAMHSARETCGSSDPLGLRDLMVAAAKTSAY